MTNSFDLEKFKKVWETKDKAEARNDIIAMAKHAEHAERYEDMCHFMRELVNIAETPLVVDERNLLSVAYKNVIGARRASWRTLNMDEKKGMNDDELMAEYRRQVEAEMTSICQDVLKLLKKVLTGTTEKEERVIYLKMTGDYYRYLAEFTKDEESLKKSKENASKFYQDALKIAEETLKATHPIRLGLALNYSVCQYEILKNKKEACGLARKAFDDAIQKLDTLDENSYKDSTLIMQLLRDNLTLWTSDQNDDEEEES
jgi:14-3-3 protein epsilon